MGTPITTGFDVYEMAITLAKNTFKGAKIQDYVTGFVEIEGPDYSNIPDGVEVHAQYGLGPMQKRGETDAFAFDSPGPAGTKKRYYESYALAAQLTEKLLMMSKYGIENKIAEELGKSYKLRQNLCVAEIYDDLLTGAIYTDADGNPMVSASHVAHGANGVTRSNLLEGPVSYSALQAALTAMRKQVSEKGHSEAVVWPQLELIIPPAYEFEVDKYTNPLSQRDPTNDHNAVNVLQTNRKWISKINPYFTSETQWFISHPGAKGIKIVNKQKLTTDTQPDVETKGVRHDVRAMWTPIEETWEEIYGSAGGA